MQRKPKKIDGMWAHDKFDPEAQNPRKAARRNAGTARNKFNGSGTGAAPGFHGNKNDARRYLSFLCVAALCLINRN